MIAMALAEPWLNSARWPRRFVVAAAVAIAVTAAAGLNASPAHAAFPGQDGRLVYNCVRPNYAAICTSFADGSGRRAITEEGQGMRWSPDGSRIVYTREWGTQTEGEELWTMAADGSDRRMVLRGPALKVGSWAPDGRRIVATVDWSQGTSSSRAEVLDTNTGGRYSLTGAEGQLDRPLSHRSVWAPSAEEIALAGFCSCPHPTEPGQPWGTGLYVVDPVDGLVIRKLTSEYWEPLDWHPNGDRLIVARTDPNDANRRLVALVDAQTGAVTPRPEFNTGGALLGRWAAFSPDTQQLATARALASGSEYTHDIGFSNTDGSNWRPIAPFLSVGDVDWGTNQDRVPDETPGCPGATIRGSEAHDRLTGTAGDDVICGLGGNDAIDGGGGNDRIFGGLGDDALAGGPGNDMARGDAGRDQVDGSGGNDDLAGGDELDSVRGGDGDDGVAGDAGNDIVRGGAGNDVIDGGAGDDETIYLSAAGRLTIDLGHGTARGEGTDRISGVEGVMGGPGADRIKGSSGADRIDGSAGRDVISGAGGGDLLLGGAGNDTVRGQAGDDLLLGGNARNRAEGGTGTDICLSFRALSGCEVQGTAATPAARAARKEISFLTAYRLIRKKHLNKWKRFGAVFRGSPGWCHSLKVPADLDHALAGAVFCFAQWVFPPYGEVCLGTVVVRYKSPRGTRLALNPLRMVPGCAYGLYPHV